MPIIAILPVVAFIFGLYFTWRSKKIKFGKKLLLSLGVIIISFVGLGVIAINIPSTKESPIEGASVQPINLPAPAHTGAMISDNPMPDVSMVPSNHKGAYHYDPATGKWVFPGDGIATADIIIHPDHPEFMRATGFIDKGVSLYSEEDGKMIRLFEVRDVARNSIIDGCAFTYGLKIYDAIDGFTEWRDGIYWSQLEWLYIRADDPNRKSSYQDISGIEASLSWLSLRSGLAPDIVVFQGTGDFKCAVFSVVEYRANDYIRLKYPNGNIEDKDYNAIVFNSSLSTLQHYDSSAEQCRWSLSAGKLYNGVTLYHYTINNGFIEYGKITGITNGEVVIINTEGKHITMCRDYVTNGLYVKEDLPQ